MYGNGGYDYSGLADPTGTDGNLRVDPKLANQPFGNLHIQPDSPCVDAGDDTLLQPDWVDMDGQPRKQGSHVDIGADESDGTAWPSGPNVILRSARLGTTPTTAPPGRWPKGPSRPALTLPRRVGGSLGGRGNLPERITLRDYVHLYGGFAGTETDRSARTTSPISASSTGATGGSVVTASQSVTP